MIQLDIKTTAARELVDITSSVKKSITDSEVREGLAVIYCPHTTGAITINEGADPDVCRDICVNLSHLIPRAGDYRHAEGNSDAHMKSSLVGCSETVIIENGQPVLGTWQKIFFAEFDGPRRRKAYLKIIGG
ncbi:MAG: secondary thiamine-phosphate synthase enzyme YjbQ [Thermodesulfobacteriota bacterium]